MPTAGNLKSGDFFARHHPCLPPYLRQKNLPPPPKMTPSPPHPIVNLTITHEMARRGGKLAGKPGGFCRGLLLVKQRSNQTFVFMADINKKAFVYFLSTCA